MNKTKIIFRSLVAAAIMLASILAFAFVSAGVTTAGNTKATGAWENFEFLSATTTTATSTNLAGGGGSFIIAGAEKVVLFFSRGGASGPNTGATRFEVQVTTEPGGTWYDFDRLFLADASQTATSSVTISAATSTTIASLDLEDQAFYAVRVIANEVTDGEHTAKAYAEF